MSIEAYLFPTTVAECLSQLSRYEGRAMLIAGGTDLMPKLSQQKLDPCALIDTSRMQRFDELTVNGAGLRIGAGVTHARAAHSARLAGLFPALARACGSVGSPQIRNVATLTGNIVTAMPGADAAVALVALDAAVEIAAPQGSRTAKVADLYGGVGRSRIDSGAEVVTAIRVPRPQAPCGNAYGRISPRNSFCFPIVNAAAALTAENGKIGSARLAMGPVADRPFRASRAEAALAGADLNDEKALAEAALLASREANPRSSCLRGCADYRRELLKVLIKQVLDDARQQILGR